MSRNSVLILLMCAAPLTGCADYLNHYDTVTLAAGDTQKYNSMLQTVDPLNPASKNTRIEGDGARAAAIAEAYKYPPPPPPPAPITVNVGTPTNSGN